MNKEINYDKAKNEFESYLDSYDRKNGSIN